MSPASVGLRSFSSPGLLREASIGTPEGPIDLSPLLPMRRSLTALAFALGTVTLPLSAAEEPLPTSRTQLTGHYLNGQYLADFAPTSRVDAGALVLEAEQVLDIVLPAPHPSRSLGLWWQGELGEAWIEPLDSDGRALFVDRFLEHPDLGPETVGVDRPAASSRVSGLVHSYLGPATGARLTLVGPCRLYEVDLVWIGAGPLPERPLDPPQPSYSASVPKPFVYDRGSWNAYAAQCSPTYCNTTHIAWHHTASNSEYQVTNWSDAAANVKAIQAYHMFTNGWCDIGYNYLIAKQGWIFEGRGGGDDVKAAHDGFNCGSMGVSAMGYFHPPYNNTPTTGLTDAFVDLAAWKCDQQGIDPLASAFYAGLGSSESTIYGHKDVKATACPGDLLYVELPSVRNAIDDVLNGGGGGLAGTLKGVLYDASVGTNARIWGGTVALADGTFVTTGSDGYYEFPLAAGSYVLGATAEGYTAASAIETVTTGDVWESLGLTPNSTAPTHQNIALAGMSFQNRTTATPGSLVWMGYAVTPGLPTAPFGSAGVLWPSLATLQALYLGSVPGSGTLAVNITVTGAPSGLTLHTQNYVLSGFQATLSNGDAWIAP